MHFLENIFLVGIGIDNGLVLERWQAISWINDNYVGSSLTVYVFPSLIVLTQWGWVVHICISKFVQHWIR